MQLGTLTFEMAANLAHLKSDMGEAKSMVADSMKSIQSSIDGATSAFWKLSAATVGIGSVAAFKGMVDSVIEAKVELQRLSIQTGASVESLSAISAVAKMTGTNVGDVGSAINKLQKNLATSQEDGRGAAQAISALGLSFNDFKALKPDEQMLEVAKAMDKFQDGGGKSAAAMLLFGKSGAQLLPMLAELAEKNELVGKTTSQSAQEALAYEKNLKQLEAAGNAWKRQMVDGILPTLVDVTDAMVQARKEGGLLASVLAGVQTFLTGSDQYKNDKALVEQTELLLRLQNDLLALKSRGYSADTGAVQMKQKQIAELQAEINTTMAYRKELQALEDIKDAASKKREAERAKNGQLNVQVPEKVLKTGPNPGLSLLNQLQTEYEAATNSVNKYLETERKLAAIRETVPAAIRSEIIALSQKLDLLRQQKIILDAFAANASERETARDAADSQFTDNLRNLSLLNQGYEFQISLIGKTTEQVTRMTAARQIDLQQLKTEIDLGNARAANLLNQDEYLKRLVLSQNAANESKNKQLELMQKEQARLRDPIAGMTDALTDYQRTVGNVAVTTKNMMANAFRGMEDALVQFVKTGQLNFANLTDSIISDLIRIQVQQNITGPLADALKSGGGLGGLFGSAKSFIGGMFADGGNPPVGVPSIVGEKGPELFIPNTAGTIVPNSALGGSVTVNQPIVINAQNASAETVGQIRALMPSLIAENKRVVEGVIQQAMARRGGRLAA